MNSSSFCLSLPHAEITGVLHCASLGKFRFVSEMEGSQYVSQAALELEILLYLLPEHWDYRCVPPHWV